MQTFLMPLLGILNILTNVGGIILVFLYPPYPYAALIVAFATLMLVSFTELYKKRLLIEKKDTLFMAIFGILIVFSVFFLSMGLTVVIYFEQVQNKVLQKSPTFNNLIWQQTQHLTQDQISILSTAFYIGNCLTLSFYTRQFYRMFWVNHIIHIFRYLKAQVHHLNQTLLSHLPKIKLTKQLKSEKCCLCIEFYQDFEQVTKLACGHIFHRNCIRLWVVRSNACPLCRKRIVLYK